MPQFGFYMAGASVPVVGGPLGLLLAWDPHNRGPSAADDLNMTDISLYSWLGRFSPGFAVARIKSRSPIQIPGESCPLTLDGSPDRDFIIGFSVKAGSVSSSLISNCSLEVFESGNLIYGIAPQGQTKQIELAEGSSASGGITELSMLDRVVMAALEDQLEGWYAFLGVGLPAKELWRALVTPNQPLTWAPV
jgi:hypothetical protein